MTPEKVAYKYNLQWRSTK